MINFEVIASGMAAGLFIGSVACMIYHIIQMFYNLTKVS